MYFPQCNLLPMRYFVQRVMWIITDETYLKNCMIGRSSVGLSVFHKMNSGLPITHYASYDVCNPCSVPVLVWQSHKHNDTHSSSWIWILTVTLNSSCHCVNITLGTCHWCLKYFRLDFYNAETITKVVEKVLHRFFYNSMIQ